MEKMSKRTLITLSAAVLMNLSACVVLGGESGRDDEEAYARGRSAPQKVIVNQHIYADQNGASKRGVRHALLKTADGKCVDRSKSSYQGLITYDCHGQANQRFAFVQDSIRVEGLCLDVAGNNSKVGAKVIAYSCRQTRNQQWFTVGRTIRSKLNGLCLDTGKSGNRLTMQPCDNSRSQQFYRSY